MLLHPSSHKQSAAQRWGGARPVSRSPGPSPLWHDGYLLPVPASRPGTARVRVAGITLTERREEGTGAPLPLGNWYQMVPPLWGPDLRAGRVPGRLRADLEDGQTAVFCQWARGPPRSSFSAHTQSFSRRRGLKTRCTGLYNISTDILGYIHTETINIPAVMFLPHV